MDKMQKHFLTKPFTPLSEPYRTEMGMEFEIIYNVLANQQYLVSYKQDVEEWWKLASNWNIFLHAFNAHT